VSIQDWPPRPRPRLARAVATACGSAILVGLAAVGVLVQPESAAVLVPLAVLGAVITFCRQDLSSPTGRAGRALRPSAVTALQVYSGGVSVVGLSALAGSATSSILTFLALAAAARWWAREQRTHGWLQVGAEQPGEPLSPTWHLGTATTAQLRLRWRASYLKLDRAPDPSVRAHIAATRRDLLTEFERRDPAGFTRFLASRDPAASYPLRFCRRLTRHARDGVDGRDPLKTANPEAPNPPGTDKGATRS
jgi:hypothetical protein